jgi:hypothetical protein
MRNGVWRLRLDRARTSTAGIRASLSPAAPACLQSVQSQYGASTELRTRRTFNTKHDTFGTKHHSEY